MTLSSFVFYRMTHHFMRIKKDVLKNTITVPEGIQLHNMVQGIVAFTLVFELVGAMLLYLVFTTKGMDNALWSAVFHSVSSFCTAGFSIYSDSLIRFQSDISVNLIVAVLSYAGAMGFIVMHDLWAKLRNFKYKITFTTKVIVLMTLFMTAIGTFQLYFFEPELAGFVWYDRLMISIFQTMSAMTTVGYNTIALTTWMPASLMIMVVVMYIGASPSGTGGGMKSTTATTAFAFVKSKLSLERDVTLMGHRLPTYRLDSAMTTFVFYTSILFAGLYALTITEDFDLMPLLFEASSALGTVGLSTGITPDLSASGKVIIILLMYIGRIGVLTFGSSMVIRLARRAKAHSMADDDIAI